MATIIDNVENVVHNMTKEERRALRKATRNIPTRITVKFMNKIYNKPLAEILANDTMMERILRNGYYRQALCDANDMAKMTIEFNGETHVLYGIPDNMKDTRLLVYGTYDWVKAVDVEIDEIGE